MTSGSTTDPEERLRALVQPIMEAAIEYAKLYAASEPQIGKKRTDAYTSAERAAILACARAQAEALRKVRDSLPGDADWREGEQQ